MQTFKKYAQDKNLEGWLLNLQMPSYHAVITFADNRELRQEIYTAYSTRASDQGPSSEQWDNSEIMGEILKLRHQEAELIGFENFADYSLATKMAESADEVMVFLNKLAERSKPMAEQEWNNLQGYARDHFDIEDIAAWDVAYVSEKLRKEQYDFSQEELRPYFPEDHVLAGLFSIAERLYGIKIIEKTDNIDKWHQDVRFFEVRDQNGERKAGFYIDLYSREQKRGGAWMDSYQDRHRNYAGKLELPIAFLVCNFTRPIDNNPALLDHQEVITLFHEFGHTLHHILTKVEYSSVSGINGVLWDAVELPSQFMENWCWEKEALDMISCHVDTKEPLPDELFQKLIASKNFQSGMKMVRQLEFSIFDFRIHREYDVKQGDQIQKILNEVRQQIAVVPAPSFNRFQNGFSHVFGGGYAAGYYSYKWAEVLSSDAFTQFEKNGIFDQKTGQRFLETILEKGGSEEPMDLFVAFQGRKPEIDALLHHCGIE